MTRTPCASCHNSTPDFILVNNDGLCNDCIAKQDKKKLEKITLNAYEEMETDRRLDAILRRKK